MPIVACTIVQIIELTGIVQKREFAPVVILGTRVKARVRVQTAATLGSNHLWQWPGVPAGKWLTAQGRFT